MSREMWKAVETKAKKTRVSKTKRRREERRREQEKTKEEEDDGGGKSGRRIGDL